MNGDMDAFAEALEAFEEADLPRFRLPSRRIALPRQLLPTEGYQRATLIHAIPFRFTALPFSHSTTWYLGF